MGYTKLFSEIIMSTVWREPDNVRIVWITMLALKDRWHVVNASLPGLADAARVTINDCEAALSVLSSPDPHSRSSEHEGRRIERCDGGWVILNGEKYRNKMSLDERREYQRIKQREYRSRVKSCQQLGQQLTHTETDTEADTDTNKHIGAKAPSVSKKFIPPTFKEVHDYCKERGNSVSPNGFMNYYESNGWKVGRNAMKDWKAAVRTWETNGRGKPNETNQRIDNSAPARVQRAIDKREAERHGRIIDADK